VIRGVMPLASRSRQKQENEFNEDDSVETVGKRNEEGDGRMRGGRSGRDTGCTVLTSINNEVQIGGRGEKALMKARAKRWNDMDLVSSHRAHVPCGGRWGVMSVDLADPGMGSGRTLGHQGQVCQWRATI